MLYGYRQEDTSPEKRMRMAVVTFLPDPLNSIVTKLREKYDPDYAIVGPHISIVSPFETDRPITEVADIVGREIQKQPVMELSFDTLEDYYPACPQICWGIKAHESLTRLYLGLHTALDIPLPYKEFRPHITIAREISEHRLIFVKEKIAPYLPRETLTVKEIDLVAPIARYNWVSVRTFFLAEPNGF